MSIVRLKNLKGKKKIILIGFWSVWFYLIWSKMLRQEADGLYAGWVNIWGDWAAHLSYATSFGYGRNWPPEMPLLAGTRFSYPFAADLVSGLLMKTGVRMITAMLVPSLVLSILLVVVLTELGKKITGSFKGGAIVSLLFLFNGGLGFWWWLKDVKSLGLVKIMTSLPREYTHLDKLANIEWINIISSQVVPQRSFLMGFPIAVLIYLLLWQRFSRQTKAKELLKAGWLTSSLPLIHAHSFVLVSWTGFWLMVMEILEKKKSLVQLVKDWSRFWLPIIMLGLPQVMFFYGGSLKQKGFIRWQPGWMAEGNLVWFWLKNFGLSLVLAGIGMKLASKKLRQFSLPFWGLFGLANLWIFQPWEWDNTKILTHWYLAACVLGAGAIIKGFKEKNKLVKGLTGLVLILSIWSGFLDTVRLTEYENLKIKFFSNQELELAEWVKKKTKPDSRFLTADNHDHWVPVLTGRKIVLGFKGWLWTYGLDYSEQERAVAKMFSGGKQAKEALKKYKVEYVVIGPKERKGNINEEFYENTFEKVYQLKETKIFKIN